MPNDMWLPDLRDDGPASVMSPSKFGWWITKPQIPKVWEETRGAGIRIAEFDTGVYTSHADFKPENFEWESTDPHNHGTHVAGIICANPDNDDGTAGVAPDVTIISYTVFNAHGQGSMDDLAAAMMDSLKHDVDIWSFSGGGRKMTRDLSLAIGEGYKKNIPLVVSSGNNYNLGRLLEPANDKRTISVGAVDELDKRASFSTGGPRLDVVAPGVSIVSTVPGGYRAYSGTSMGCPHVTSVLALGLSKHRTITSATPMETVEEMRSHLRWASTDLDTPGFDPRTGFGRPEPLRVIELDPTKEPIPPDEPARPLPVATFKGVKVSEIKRVLLTERRRLIPLEFNDENGRIMFEGRPWRKFK